MLASTAWEQWQITILPRYTLKIFWQDFHFLLQDPWTLELILKRQKNSRIIDFDTFLKGFRRVLEGALKGPRLTPSKTLLKPLQRPLQKPFWNPSGVRGFCSRSESLDLWTRRKKLKKARKSSQRKKARKSEKQRKDKGLSLERLES